jgi:adenosylhomocysteine nucleosidase
VLVYSKGKAVVAVAGIGASRVALAVEAATRIGEVREIVSIGVAGACCPNHPVGSIVLPSIVVNARTGERFTSASGEGVLVSVDQVASVPEKRRLFSTYQADLVDMEAATVARMAEARSLPFRAIKAVSDGPEFELSDTTAFATPDGQFREAAFALYAAVRPRLWRPLLELARNSKLAISNLTKAVQNDLERI